MLAPEEFDIFFGKGRVRMSPRSCDVIQWPLRRILVFT